MGDEVRKCKMCGKTLVGKNKLGICSACQKKTGDTGITVLGVGSIITAVIVGAIKWFGKRSM